MEATSGTGVEIHDSILDAVGDTPLVRLSRLGKDLRPQLVAKIEALNPGGSIKDRAAIALIEAAERDGKLKPGGTIVEPTSGNTGTGLAIAAALKGYRVIAVMPDKMSKEKIDLLRAYGAEVVVAPTEVAPESPESYYRVADRLTEEIPGAFQPNQYRNQANPEAHYESTGPEIWEQTGGKITHLVLGVGVGLVEVLVGLEGAGDLLGEAIRHAVVRLGRLRRHLGRRDDDLGTVRAQQVDLLLRHLVRHHRDHAVALECRRYGQAGAGVAARGLDDRAARLELAVALGGIDQGYRGAVLDRAARVEGLHLRDQLWTQVLAEAREPHERRVADRIQDGVMDLDARSRGRFHRTLTR